MKAYKFRIYPTSNQVELLAKHFGCVRFIYNWALNRKDSHYKETKENISAFSLIKEVTQLKKTDKPWLKEVNSQSLQMSIKNLDIGFTNFFKKRAKFPRFKSKHAKQSFQCPQNVKASFDDSKLFIPKFREGIKAKFHRHFEGKIKTVTISKTPSGKYFASILVDQQKEPVKPAPVDPDQTLGLDLGLTHFLISSDGKKVDNPRFLTKSLSKLKKAQRILCRKKKGSNNRLKQKLKVAITHEKVANQRLDFIHKLTAKLVYENQETSFAIEDLNIKGMIKNHKLARAITDVSWSKFLEILRYKAEWFGKNILKIGRFEVSSKLCHVCWSKVDELPLSVRHWTCNECGTKLDRDINASINIKNIAITDTLGHSVSVKSSPDTKLVGASVSAKGQVTDESEEAPTIKAVGV